MEYNSTFNTSIRINIPFQVESSEKNSVVDQQLGLP